MAFDPDQPRDEQGQWTDEGWDRPTAESDARYLKLAKQYVKMDVSRSEAGTVLNYLGRSADWNNDLRGRQGEPPGVNKTNLDAMIARAPALKSDTVLYRGVEDRFVMVNSSGFISDKAYLSTSRDRQTAVAFARGRGRSPAIMKIEAPAGSKVLELHSAEREVIFPRNAKFKVLRVERGSAGRPTVYHVRYAPR